MKLGAKWKKNKEQAAVKRARTPSVFQIEVTECGAACLSMILKYYRCSIPMEEIRYECGVSRDGCSAADLVRAAEVFGLRAKGYRRTLEGLRQTQVPCVLHWNFSHFVVLEGVKKNYAWINDPATGRRKVSWEEMDAAFTGIVLCFEPGENFVRREQPSTLIKMIQKRLSVDKGGMLFIVLVGLLLVIPGLLLAVFTQSFVDAVLMKGNPSLVTGILLSILFTYLFQIFFTWSRSYALTRLRLKMNLIANGKQLKKMFRLPATFFEQRYAGELSQRMESNAEVNNFLAGNFSETLLNIVQAAFYLILMAIYSPLLTLVGCLGVGISVGVSMLLLKPLENLNSQKVQNSSRLSGMLCAGLSASATIKASGVENEYVSDILSYYAQNTDSEQKLGRTQQIVSAIPSSISNVFHVLVLIIGGSLIIRGSCSTGTLTAFCQLLTSFVAPINMLLGIAQRVQSTKAAMARIEDIDAAKVDPRYDMDDATVDPGLPVKLSGHIEARNLVFGYNPGLDPIVHGYSLRATPGSRIAVVGSSGCGKSTVGKLLAGLLFPWQGEVLYDGISLSRIPAEYLCESLSVIGQSSAIFSGTIRDNLTFWRGDYSDQALFSAVMDAQAYDMINKLPGGMEFVLNEGGRNLSGGQRQRLEIARALISNPSILIMDEATSALDAVTEKQVMDGIRRRGCTCIIIAHRLSTIRDCDLIMVLDQGRVVECGTHDKLMQHGGLYTRLVGN